MLYKWDHYPMAINIIQTIKPHLISRGCFYPGTFPLDWGVASSKEAQCLFCFTPLPPRQQVAGRLWHEAHTHQHQCRGNGGGDGQPSPVQEQAWDQHDQRFSHVSRHTSPLEQYVLDSNWHYIKSSMEIWWKRQFCWVHSHPLKFWYERSLWSPANRYEYCCWYNIG